MAHANYNCCAICDCGFEYAGLKADSKVRICEDCLVLLRDYGYNIITIDELIDFINNSDIDKLKEFLNKLNFRACFYSNPIDNAVIKRGIDFDKNGKPKPWKGNNYAKKEVILCYFFSVC